MTKRTENNYKPVSPQQVEELTAIYDDYLYYVREYEKMLQSSTMEKLAGYQMEKLCVDGDYDFPWELKPLSYYDKKQFDDFVDEKIHTNTGKAYVTLQRTNPEDNQGKTIEYVPQPYAVSLMNMPLPSAIERYVVVFPEEAKVGETEFYIDGYYKAVYRHKGSENQSVIDFLDDAQKRSELRILINLVESLRKNQYILDSKYKGYALGAYAAETTVVYENNILELLGSFAEKLQSICRKRYGIIDGREVFDLAQNEGLVDSTANFRDYVNIRNLMRHQWDTMDELGYFNAMRASRNAEVREKYAKSYLKLCDKTIIQRMKSYVDVLHQMQQIVGKINPQRIIRGNSESNSSFASRIKSLYRQNPQQPLKVELNHPLISDKYKALNRNLHKIVPQIEILDDFSQKSDDLRQMDDDYNLRTWFLHTYHSLECSLMTYCITRGRDLKKHEAWEYLKTMEILSPQECETWQNYSNMRNMLCHNYFSGELRQQLRKMEETYLENLNNLGEKMFNISPEIRWIQKGVYEYTHKDGTVARLDFVNHQVLYAGKPAPQPQVKVMGKIDLTDTKLAGRKAGKTSQEKYANGVEFTVENNKVTEVKLPCGMRINLDKQRVIWDVGIALHTNAEKFNVLQTTNIKLIMDKDFRVTEFTEKNKKQSVRGGDVILLDYRHRAVLDSNYHIREFKYRNADGKIELTTFNRDKNGLHILTLPDGTNVALMGTNIAVIHGNKRLSYENRQEFATSYNGGMPSQFFKGGNGR